MKVRALLWHSLLLTLVVLLVVGCNGTSGGPGTTPLAATSELAPTVVPATATPAPTSTATVVPATATSEPTPTPAVPPGPEGWLYYENEDFHVALYHPPDWEASIKTANDGTKLVSVAAPEVGSLDIVESPFLANSRPEEWADGLKEQLKTAQPGAWEFVDLGPIITLDQGAGYVFEAHSTQFSIKAFKAVVIYDETAFQVTGVYGGFENDEQLISGYKGILDTIQKR